MKPAIVVLSAAALPLARRIAALTGGEVHGPAGRVEAADRSFAKVAPHLTALFREGRPILALMASGALIRILAPSLADERSPRGSGSTAC